MVVPEIIGERLKIIFNIMQLKEIQVVIDTNVVEANTKDALAVRLIYEESVLTGEVIKNDEKITGDNLKRTQERVIHLGDLKQSQLDKDAQILELEGKIKAIKDDKTSIDALITAVSPELDKAIDTIRANNP
jgi:hypothetical protein